MMLSWLQEFIDDSYINSEKMQNTPKAKWLVEYFTTNHIKKSKVVFATSAVEAKNKVRGISKTVYKVGRNFVN